MKRRRALNRQGALARLFLSYAREDAERVEALASALEHAGHDLWWDRKIAGGSEYSGEIEAALENAEAVIVVWTRTSARSAWVRDEAAFARDRGRLLPVLVDETGPPLGFRQIHAVDLKAWDGRFDSPELAELLRAIDVRAAMPTQPRPQPVPPPVHYGLQPAVSPAPSARIVSDDQPAPREMRKRRLLVIGAVGLVLISKCAIDDDDHDKPSSKGETTQVGEEASDYDAAAPNQPRIDVDKGGHDIVISSGDNGAHITVTPSSNGAPRPPVPQPAPRSPRPPN